MRTEAAGAKHFVAHRELADRRANRRDLASELAAENLVLRSPDAGKEPREERLAAAPTAIRSVDGGRVNLYQHLVGLRNR